VVPGGRGEDKVVDTRKRLAAKKRNQIVITNPSHHLSKRRGAAGGEKGYSWGNKNPGSNHRIPQMKGNSSFSSNSIKGLRKKGRERTG